MTAFLLSMALLALIAAAWTFDDWGRSLPTWGGDALWLMAAVAAAALITVLVTRGH